MATRTVARIYDRALAPTGLRATGLAILSRLEEEGPFTVGDLAARLTLEPSTCSREVALLVKAGLAASDIGSDRRARNLVITDAGRARRADALRLRDEVQNELRGIFGAHATDALLEALQELVIVGQRLEGVEVK